MGAFLFVPEAQNAATEALRIIAVGLVFAGIAHIISAYFQSLGFPTASYLISIGTLVGIKLPLVVGLGTMGPLGMWIALSLGEALSALAAGVVLKVFGGRTKLVAKEPA